MKKYTGRIIAMTIIWLLFFTYVANPEYGIWKKISVTADAATFADLNQEGVFVLQQKSDTCTLASTVMLLRRTAILKGDPNWKSFNETTMEQASNVWNMEYGLYQNFTYQGIRVSHKYISATVDKKALLINLLQLNPQGIIVYSGKHAVLLTDYTDGVFYCADPYRNAKRLPLDTPGYTVTVDNINAYWYVVSPDLAPPVISNVTLSDVNSTGYTITCQVADNTGIAKVYMPSWNSDIHTGGDAVWLEATVSGNVATCRVNIADLKAKGLDGNYQTHIYAYDAAGNYYAVAVPLQYIDTTAPVISNVSIVSQDALGYDIRCKVTDNNSISRIQFPSWTTSKGQDDLTLDWASSTKYSGTLKDGYYYFRVNISDHGNETGLYTTQIYAYDQYGNRTQYSKDLTNMVTAGYTTSSVVYHNHIYTMFQESLSWTNMKALAQSMNGSLATITSKEEQAVVAGLVATGTKSQYLLGGARTSTTAAYTWLTGETFGYTNWQTGQPDYANSNEYYLAMNRSTGLWSDVKNGLSTSGFVLETDLNQTPTYVVKTDQSIYEYYTATLPWDVARIFAESKGGHLVTITSDQENAQILSGIKAAGGTGTYLLGASDSLTEGQFNWTTGESMTYTNWKSGQPDNLASAGGQDYLAIGTDGTWSDVSSYTTGYSYILEYDVTPVSNLVPTIEKTTYTYDGNVKQPQITIVNGSYTLINGMDYQVEYENNKNTGTGIATVKGLGHYIGSVTKTFTIKAKSISKFSASVATQTLVFDGKAKEPLVTLKDGTTLLKKGQDYTLSYTNNLNKGTGTVTITGIGNYIGTIQKTFSITPKKISELTATLKNKSYTYTGKALNAEVTLLNGKTILTKDVDYTLSYLNYVKPGIATVTVTGKGNYTGTLTLQYSIKPAPVKLTPTSANGSVTFKWTKTTGVTGYVIYCSTSKTGTYTKLCAVGATVASYTKTGLVKGKTYYYKIRSYTKTNAGNLYSSYSEVVSVKIK